MIKKPNKGDRWSREEMILVLNLYFKIPFMKFRTSTPEVQELARIMGRTVNTVAIRLSNFASCDPNLTSRGIKGMNDHVKQCQPYWDEFAANRNELVFESEKILAEYQETTIEKKFKKELVDIPKSLKGESRIVEVKARVNQHFFRELVLTNYDSKCALTGIDLTELLVASHIIPWADNEEERLNPANGICLSSLYDKTFDCGLISFQDDGQVIFSGRLEGNVGKDYYAKHFQIIKGRKLATPQKYNLNPAFLEWHRDIVFKH